MRLKTSNACCAFAWSPASLGTPAMVATASFSGAMSDDFDNTAYLELLLADVTQTDQTEMPVVGKISIPDRACRIDWSSHTGQQGILAVACTNSRVYIYSAAAVLKAGPQGGDGKAALLCTIQHHQASVRACQFNLSQPHFLATGDDAGVWFLWSLPNPGAAEWQSLQPLEIMQDKKHSHAIVQLQWHPRYAHIIATAAANGTVNAWNLKTESLVTSLNVSKASRGAGATCIAWNPTAATQMAVGLDDVHPVVQIWDLKCAMSPVRELQGHTRGVSGLAWCAQDASMLASCGGDGHTLWWDPATGLNCGELQPESSFIVDVQWCPVLRGVLATSSFTPLLCVSTAQASGAPALSAAVKSAGASGSADSGAAHGSSIPKWIIPPCRASINLALVVASQVPGTTAGLQLTQLEASSPMSPKFSQDMRFKGELANCPPGTEERVQWLKQHRYPLLAAVASSRSDRQPILAYLQRSEESEQQVRNGPSVNRTGSGLLEEDGDPFAQLSQEQQKSYEERAAEHICNGQIEEAVEVCLDSGRYADAFTLAFLRGGAMIAKVHQRYVQYVAAEHQERRHVLIAGTIASGDFCKLVEQQVPWQEALSAIIAYVVDGFADACNRLGDALKEAGNYDGAYACYVCGRNVDGVVELWRIQGVPSRTVVQDTILLEETMERASSSYYLAQCLCDYGLKLVSEGHPNEAAEYLNRAARIGDQTAAVLVDRMRYILNVVGVNGNAPPPYKVEPIADHPSATCGELITRQRERQMQQEQQQLQRVSSIQSPQQQQQQYPPQVSSVPQQQQPGRLPMNNSPHPSMSPMPAAQDRAVHHPTVNQSNSGAYARSLPSPQQHQQQQQQPSVSTTGAPPTAFASPQLQQQSQLYPPRPGATAAPSVASQPGASSVSSSNLPPHPSTVPSRPPLVASSAPPMPGTAPVAYRQDPQQHLQPRPAMPLAAGPPPPMPHPQQYQQQQQQQPVLRTPVGPPQPRLMPHPVSAYSSMRASPAGAASAQNSMPPPPPPPGMAAPTGPRGGSQPSSITGSFNVLPPHLQQQQQQRQSSMPGALPPPPPPQHQQQRMASMPPPPPPHPQQMAGGSYAPPPPPPGARGGMPPPPPPQPYQQPQQGGWPPPQQQQQQQPYGAGRY